MVDPSGKTSLASNRTIAAAARRYFNRTLILPVSLSFNVEVVVQVPYSCTFVIGAIARRSHARSFAVLLEVRSICWRAIVKPLNEAPASRSALDRKTNSREHRLSMDIQFDLQANCSCTAATHRAGVLRRTLGGRHGLLSSKRSHRRPLDSARPVNRRCCAYARRRQQ